MDLIPGKRYEWYINDREDKKQSGLFTGEYEKNGNALLTTREGEEWSVPVEGLRKYVKMKGEN